MDLALWLMIGGWIFVAIWIPIVIGSNRKTHPKALFVLFFAEMWERFSYYGMRALLVLYMVRVLFDGQALADSRALGIYGSYTAMVYLFPVLGGLAADYIYGFRRAVVIGGILMMLGHFALALEGMMFEGNMILFYLSLSLIIIGNGFFKPNISSFLGKFYSPNDPRKDGGFTIFYMGINIGAFLATLTCGYVGEQISWHYGFGLAGIGMLFGVLMFVFLGPSAFGNKGINPNNLEIAAEEDEIGDSNPIESPELIEEKVREEKEVPFTKIDTPALRKKQWWTLIATILFIPVCALMLDLSAFMTGLLVVLSLGILGFLVFSALTSKDKVAGQRLLVVVVLFFFHAIFWALFEQAGGSITLFTARNVDRTVMGSEIPASIFQSLNAFFIMVLAPVFSWIWIQLSRRRKEPSTPMKFVIGLSLLAVGFGIIVLGAKFFPDSEGLVPLLFIVFMYLFHTMGELSLSPVGLSMITKLSPPKIVGFVMGAWFLSIALANKLAGLIGSLTASSQPGEDVTPIESLGIYAHTYLIWGVVVVGGAAFILIFLVPTLRRSMHGIH